MGAHPLHASACVGYVGHVMHSRKIGIGIGNFDYRRRLSLVQFTKRTYVLYALATNSSL